MPRYGCRSGPSTFSWVPPVAVPQYSDELEPPAKPEPAPELPQENSDAQLRRKVEHLCAYSVNDKEACNRELYSPQHLVTISVGGSATISVHAHVLRRHSEFFKSALKECWLDGDTKTIEMPEEAPKDVSLYADYCYSGNLLTSRNEDGKMCRISMGEATSLWLLADKILDNVLKRLTMMYLFQHRKIIDDVQKGWIVHICDAPPGSRLMQFMVDLLLYHRAHPMIKDIINDLPLAVTRTLLAEALENTGSSRTQRSSNFAMSKGEGTPELYFD